MARGYNYAPGASPEINAAQAPGLDKAALAAHGRSKNAVVRAIIAARTDCPFGLMVTLAHDSSAEVRVAVAGNPTAIESVMEHLSHDKSVEVLLALIANPALPEPALEMLAFHKKSEVREAATRRLDHGGVGRSVTEDAATPELRDVGSGARNRLAFVEDLTEDELAATGTDGTHTVASTPTVEGHRTAPVRGFKAK